MTGEHAQIVSNCGKSILTESSSGLAWPGGPTHPDLLLLLRPEREYTVLEEACRLIWLHPPPPHLPLACIGRLYLHYTERRKTKRDLRKV
jgi:hypothetical protein